MGHLALIADLFRLDFGVVLLADEQDVRHFETIVGSTGLDRFRRLAFRGLHLGLKLFFQLGLLDISQFSERKTEVFNPFLELHGSSPFSIRGRSRNSDSGRFIRTFRHKGNVSQGAAAGKNRRPYHSSTIDPRLAARLQHDNLARNRHHAQRRLPRETVVVGCQHLLAILRCTRNEARRSKVRAISLIMLIGVPDNLFALMIKIGRHLAPRDLHSLNIDHHGQRIIVQLHRSAAVGCHAEPARTDTRCVFVLVCRFDCQRAVDGDLLGFDRRTGCGLFGGLEGLELDIIVLQPLAGFCLGELLHTEPIGLRRSGRLPLEPAQNDVHTLSYILPTKAILLKVVRITDAGRMFVSVRHR